MKFYALKVKGWAIASVEVACNVMFTEALNQEEVILGVV